MFRRKRILTSVIAGLLSASLGAHAEFREGQSSDQLAQGAMADSKVSTMMLSGQRVRSDRFIVKADNFREARRAAQSRGLRITKTYENISKARGHWVGVMENTDNMAALSSTGDRVQALSEKMDALSIATGIRSVQPDHIVSIAATPNDPRLGDLWGLHNTGQSNGTADADIDAPEAWDLFKGSDDVVVMVIDTGIDYSHPDLADNMWKNPNEIPGNGIDDDNNGYVDDIYGIDTTNKDSDPMDDNRHGTHCAGTIGARGDNGTGVVGVNWKVKLAACKFLNSGGSGSVADAVDCMDYMIGLKRAGNNIVVSSNSWGGTSALKAMEDAIEAAANEGILFVAAAGNNGSDNNATSYYPSGYNSDAVISVAATDRNDNLADFSNYGATTVDLAAPGVATISTTPNNSYQSLSGTSMATPHVSGVVALLAGVFPNDSIAQRKARIMDYVDQIPAMQGKSVSGGRLNAFKSVQSAPFLVADFNWSKVGEFGRQFTDVSSANFCNVTGWNWDFGDGNSSTEQNPLHTYSAEGWYNVSMTAQGDECPEDVKTVAVWAGPNLQPKAAFTYTVGGGLTAAFSDQSEDLDGKVSSWLWDFGDGTTSREQNPSHQYPTSATYNVTLTTTDDEGATGVETQSVFVPLVYCDSSASSSGPVAITRFSLGQYSNRSDGQTYSDFTDEPIQLMAGQNYSATVETSSNFWQGHTRVWIDFNRNAVFENSERVYQEASKGTTSSTISIPSSVITGEKMGMRVSMQHGEYRAACATNDGWGEVEDYMIIVDGDGAPQPNRPPVADFNFSSSELSVNFTDQSRDSDGSVTTWAWDFGDGTSSNERNPEHQYASEGTYTVSLSVTDDDGARASVDQQVSVSEGSGNNPPTADFSYSLAGELSVNFSDESSDTDGSIVNWSWDFGDGASSNDANPSHTYASAGTYSVRLTVMDDAGASNTSTQRVTLSTSGEFPEYCDSSSARANPMFISQVSLDEFDNSSLRSRYTDFTNLTVDLSAGQSHTITLTPTSNQRYQRVRKTWRLWVDFNRDGDFNDSGELVVNERVNTGDDSALEKTFTVPRGAVRNEKLGMRVSLSANRFRDSCENRSGLGEVEDYGVIIK